MSVLGWMATKLPSTQQLSGELLFKKKVLERSWMSRRRKKRKCRRRKRGRRGRGKVGGRRGGPGGGRIGRIGAGRRRRVGKVESEEDSQGF